MFLLERDAISGKEGRAFTTIGGRNSELFGLKKFRADAEYQEEDFTVVGTRVVQKRDKGVLYTGNMTVYYGTPDFIRLAERYLRLGRAPYIDVLQVTNDDRTSSVGVQTVAFYNVKLQKIPISILDADVSTLMLDIPFSYSGFEVLSWYKEPAQFGSN
jgi:hypothetical protein